MDFRTTRNVKLTAHAQDDLAVKVAQVGRLGSETIQSTHNLADPTTWYTKSVRVTDASLQVIADTDNKEFEHPSEHKNWIDLIHGKVMDEDGVIEYQQAANPGDPHGYGVVVKVDGVEQTMRPPFATDWTEGGDYYVDYESGKVVFEDSQTGTVTASFSYRSTAPGNSMWILKPLPGKQLEIEKAEVQYTSDVIINDTITHRAMGYVGVFAPQLVPVPFPDPYTLIELDISKYKTLGQIVDEARGAYPVIPAIGGAARGLSHDSFGFPFIYGAVRVLKSAAGMELQVYLEDDKPCGGERATGTFYCASTPDPDWSE
jgi:hypothetical protein